MNNSQITTMYKQNAKEINEILNDWDPIGVLPNKGGPKDEYECLIAPILSLLKCQPNKEELIKLIDAEIKGHFGLVKVDGYTNKVTANILKWWEAKSNS